MASRTADLYDLAHAYGYELKRKRTHLIWQHIVTGFVAVTSASASDRHALNQAERLFRKGATA
jgi:hypothetical protein